MKKRLKALAGLVMGGVITIAPVMTASAETAAAGGTYQITFRDLSDVPCQVVYSGVPLYNASGDDFINTLMVGEAEDGYEIKQVYIYLSNGYRPAFWMDADGRRDLVDTPEFKAFNQISGFYCNAMKMSDFTVDVNGQPYPHCALYMGVGDCSMPNAPDAIRLYTAIKLPKNYNGNSYIQIFDSNANWQKKESSLDYFFTIAGESGLSWKQDDGGWWVQRPDGSYLKNEWYSDNGKWYYMGADGYMLTNTTTPDGYQVNAEGVWVQEGNAGANADSDISVDNWMSVPWETKMALYESKYPNMVSADYDWRDLDAVLEFPDESLSDLMWDSKTDERWKIPYAVIVDLGLWSREQVITAGADAAELDALIAGLS